jgi:amidohydrolase
MILQRHLLSLLLLFIVTTCFCQTIQKKINSKADELTPHLIDFYKDLHQTPELSLQEVNTSKKISAELKKLGFEVTENMGGFGVVGVFKNGKGPTVLVRTDMDGLPVEEQTNLDYASKAKATDKNGKQVNVMHACGHDVHMTVFTGTAQTLIALKDQWKGTLVMVGQPAEEIGAGAKAMLDQGLYSKFPKPDYAVALHDNAFLPAGKVGYKKEYVMASVDRIDITVFGKGGHGAAPQSTVDPIVMASQMVLAFQTIVSRETNPIQPSVLTVGSFHAGNTHNIIPDQVKLQLTIRSYSDEVRAKTIESIKRIMNGIAMAAGMPETRLPQIEIDPLWTPATFNDPALTAKVTNSIASILGKENVVEVEPYMVGEDFCFFSRTKEKVPGCIFWLGAVDPEKYENSKKEGQSLPSLHSSKFAPLPEPTIKTGIRAMTISVMDLFNEKVLRQ